MQIVYKKRLFNLVNARWHPQWFSYLDNFLCSPIGCVLFKFTWNLWSMMEGQHDGTVWHSFQFGKGQQPTTIYILATEVLDLFLILLWFRSIFSLAEYVWCTFVVHHWGTDSDRHTDWHEIVQMSYEYLSLISKINNVSDVCY